MRLFITTFLLCFSTVAMARGGGGGNSVACLANVLAGEANGTESGMLDVARVVMKRVSLGEGSVCAVSYAPGQFVGVRKGARVGGATKALAYRVAAHAIQNNLKGPYRQFRTAGFGYNHCGVVRNGNVYFNQCTARRAENRSRRRHTAQADVVPAKKMKRPTAIAALSAVKEAKVEAPPAVEQPKSPWTDKEFGIVPVSAQETDESASAVREI